jgi:predicted PurR-regulated permease PerM
MTEDPEKSDIRYEVTLAAFAVITLFVLWVASDAIMLIFAGILVAAFLDGLTHYLGKLLPWRRGIRLAIVCTVLGVLLLAGIGWGSAAIAMQAGELAETLREQIDQVLGWLEDRGIVVPQDFGLPPADAGGEAAQGDDGGGEGGGGGAGSLLPNVSGLFGTAWTALAVIFGVLGNAVFIIFLGLFFAIDPAVYRDAVLLLVPPRRRKRVGAVLDESGEMLRHWLLGQALTMTVIFLVSWAGLWLAGIEPSFALGLQAGLFNFIPNLGPLVAGVAIVLAGLAMGVTGALSGLAIYVTIQILESYLLTPFIQERAIRVPPAFLFSSQLVMGFLFGFYGLALATPLAALARVFILRFYVEDRLGDRSASHD